MSYKLKTDEELIDIIAESGDGLAEFNTEDIERLLNDKLHLELKLKEAYFVIEETEKKVFR